MEHDEFRIGGTFWSGGVRWRCTDIGTRVIIAIRLDHVEVGSTAPELRRTLDYVDAEKEDWFNGLPYALAEVVFDEDAIEGCSINPDPEDADLTVSMTETRASELAADDRDSPETLAKLKAQAKALREQARLGGLRFKAYLPPTIADWLLGHVERGTFRDPSEAVFVMLGEQQGLEPHADLRREFSNAGFGRARRPASQYPR
jgi:hypothetical protein